jgi:sugar phosphate isomerase/epimerase
VIEQFAASRARVAEARSLSAAGDAIKTSSRSRLSVNQVTTHRRPFIDDLTAFHAEGFEAVGLLRSKVAEFGEERAVEFVRDLGLAVSTLSWAGGFTGSEGESFFDAIDDARRTVRLAGELGAQNLVLISGSRMGHIVSHAKRLLIDAVKALADDAAEQGVLLALQPVDRACARDASFLHSLDDTLEVIERSGRLARIAFDVCHLRQEPRLLDRIADIAPCVGVVQLSDWTSAGPGSSRAGAHRLGRGRCLPGDGEIPLPELIQAFDEAGYRGYYEINVWSDELWKWDFVELLRECRTRLDRLCRALPAPAARE